MLRKMDFQNLEVSTHFHVLVYTVKTINKATGDVIKHFSLRNNVILHQLYSAV